MCLIINTSKYDSKALSNQVAVIFSYYDDNGDYNEGGYVTVLGGPRKSTEGKGKFDGLKCPAQNIDRKIIISMSAVKGFLTFCCRADTVVELQFHLFILLLREERLDLFVPVSLIYK